MKALNSLGDFVLVVGKILVTSCMTIAGFYWFKSQPEIGNFFVIPVLMTAVFSYCVAHSFMSVYEAAVDTLLLCYCKDATDVDTGVADGIIKDAVDELDGIDAERKKKKEERKKKKNGEDRRRGEQEEEQVFIATAMGPGKGEPVAVRAEEEL